MKDEEQDLGISRLDQDGVGTHGWQVRIQRKGVRHGRFFSDFRWGGKGEALAMARRYRDRLLAQSERRESRSLVSTRHQALPTSRNRSGVVGVTEIRQRSTAGVVYRFWQASWTTVGGVRETIRFSVRKYGDEEAFRRACQARRKAME